MPPPSSPPPLGQHFLTSREYIGRIIGAIKPSPKDRFIEIGPGKGALTRALLEAERIVAIEKDQKLATQLQKALARYSQFVLYNHDFLDFSFSRLHRYGEGGWRVVGNLPYSVATPILRKLVKSRRLCRDLWLTVQREVADRICAKPGSSPYGYFSLFCQLYMEPSRLFDIPPTAFRPPPKVFSTFLAFQFKSETPGVEEKTFLALLRKAFAHRRKTLRKNLELAGVSRDVLRKIFNEQRLDPMVRPQQLSLNDYLIFFRHFQGVE